MFHICNMKFHIYDVTPSNICWGEVGTGGEGWVMKKHGLWPKAMAIERSLMSRGGLSYEYIYTGWLQRQLCEV